MREASGDWIDKWVGWAFLWAVGLAPLFFGANVPLAWGVNAAAFGLLLCLYGLAHTIAGRPFPVPFDRIAIPVYLFAVVCLWIYLQACTWTPAFLHSPIWADASNRLGETLPGRISINPAETEFGLLRLCTVAAVFFLALQIGRNRIWARRIIAAVAIAGTLHSVYALILKALGPQAARVLLSPDLFWLEQSPRLSGLFVNCDHFAIYLGLAIICAWTLLVHDIRAKIAYHGFDDHREALAQISGMMSEAGRYAVLLVPLTIALLLTVSRAGFFLSLVAVLLVAGLETNPGKSHVSVQSVRKQRQRHGLRRRYAVPIGVAILGVIAALLVHGDDLGGRLAQGNLESDVGTRLEVAKSTLNAIADNPLTGYGYSTFADAFPLYRSASLRSADRWEEAHNSYLEALLGLGLPIALLLFGMFATVVWRCWRGVRTRKRDRLAPVVAVAATLIVALHSAVDFSIQIQGVAATYAALLGAGYTQSWSSQNG